MSSAAASLPSIAPELPEIMEPRVQLRGLIGMVSRNPSVAIALVVIAILVLAALFAPWLGTVDPLAIDPTLRSRLPSVDHLFGTDALGRDLWSRVMFGTRVSLIVGFSVAILATGLGVLLGAISGYIRAADTLVMRLMDAVISIPSILLAIALVSLTRPSVSNVIIAITIAEIPRVARLVRAVVLSLRELPYVEAGLVSGCSTAQLMRRHILPNAIAPIIVQATYICASAMILEATLSFIGAGSPSSVPSWGNIMAEGRSLWQVRPLIVLIPAAFLSITVLAVNMIGDGLRDALDSRLVKDLLHGAARCRRSPDAFPDGERHQPRRSGRELFRQPRRDARHCRRVRLWKVRHVNVNHAAAPPWIDEECRTDRIRWSQSARDFGSGDAQCPRQ